MSKVITSSQLRAHNSMSAGLWLNIDGDVYGPLGRSACVRVGAGVMWARQGGEALPRDAPMPAVHVCVIVYLALL